MNPDHTVYRLQVDRTAQREGYVEIHMVNPDLRLTVRTQDAQLIALLGRFGQYVSVDFRDPSGVA